MSTSAGSILPESGLSDPPSINADGLTSSQASNQNSTTGESAKEKEKRRLFGLLKKKNSKNKGGEGLSPDTTPTASPGAANMQASSAATPAKPIPRSISPGPQPHMTPPSHPTHFPGSPQSHVSAASPSRYVRSSSPRLHSPASSLIFERNVQEAPLPDDLQSAIPHHIQTEDYIPSILEASTHMITDERLNPDDVEIVMHSAHQPASNTITHQEAGVGSGGLSPLSLGHGSDVPMLSPSAFQDGAPEDQANHYGALDSTDVRRLSFISFADVVQGEHAHDGSNSTLPRDLHMSLLSSTRNRSPSPVRSPASSPGPGELGMSPPTSGAPSMKGVDITGKQPSIGAYPGSPNSLTSTQSPSQVGGELTVETMRQALRKTGSGDLSAARSPISPVERSSVFLPGGGGAGTDEAK
jgi:hypothetical protein